MPFIVWKTCLLAHIIFFFVTLSFSVAALQKYQEDTERPLISPIQRKYLRVLENMFVLMKICCVFVFGPVLMVECIVWVVFYSEIRDGCTAMTDSIKGMITYILVGFALVAFSMTAFFVVGVVTLTRLMRRRHPALDERFIERSDMEEESEEVSSWEEEQRRVDE